VIAIERQHLTLESHNPTQPSQEVTTETVTNESAAQLASV
jgi:hypothetical protein